MADLSPPQHDFSMRDSFLPEDPHLQSEQPDLAAQALKPKAIKLISKTFPKDLTPQPLLSYISCPSLESDAGALDLAFDRASFAFAPHPSFVALFAFS